MARGELVCALLRLYLHDGRGECAEFAQLLGNDGVNHPLLAAFLLKMESSAIDQPS